jgi:hypothetical protein
MKTVIPLIAVVSLALAGCSSSPKETTVSKTPVWSAFPSQPNAYYINSVAISGDASRVVGGTFFHSYGGTTRYDALTMKSTASSSNGTFGTYCYDRAGNPLWKDEFTGFEGVYWVDISTDGAYAASGGWMSGSPNYAGFVRAFDASNGTKLLDYSTTSRVNQVELTADGTWLVSAAESLVLFKRVDGVYKKTGEFTPPGTDPTVVTAVISADGNWIVYADYSGNVVLLANKGGLPVLWKQWKLPSNSSHCVRITPDGSAFAVGGSQGYFYFFDTASFIQTGQPTITSQMSSKASVYGVAIADDGSAFVGVSNLTPSSTDGGLVYFVPRSSTTGTPTWTYQTARNPNCASLNLASGLLAVADGHPDGTPGNFYLLNTSSGSVIWQYGTSNMSWPIMISADGTAVVAGSDDSNIYYFNAAP